MAPDRAAQMLALFKTLRTTLDVVQVSVEPAKTLLWGSAGRRLEAAALEISAVLDYLNPGWDDPGDDDA